MPNVKETKTSKAVKVARDSFLKIIYKNKGRERTEEEDVCPDENGLSITIDGITFTLICKSEQDDQPYIYQETVTEGSCDSRQQHIDAILRGSRRCSSVGTYNSRDMVCFVSSGVEGYLYAYRSSSELGIWRLAYLRDGDCGLFKGEQDYVQGTLIHHCLMKLINKKWNYIPLATHFIPTLGEATKPCYAYHQQKKSVFCLVSPFITPVIQQMIDDALRCNNSELFNILKITCANQNREGLSTIWGKLIAFGNVLASNFELKNQRIINSYVFNEKYAKIKAKIKICSVEMGNDYVLIYCKYEATYNNKTVKGCYGIALLPATYSVSRYGIYNCYVRANVFICKPFFYVSMCHPRDSHGLLLCEKEYLYAGFIFECEPFIRLGEFSYNNGELQGIIDNLRNEARSHANNTPTDYGYSTASIETISSSLPSVPSIFISAASAASSTLRRVLSNVPSLAGGNKSHRKGKSHKKRTKRKTQKRRSYSIFRSNK